MKAFNRWWAIILLAAILNQPLLAETNLKITYKYEYLKAFALTLENLAHQAHKIYLKDEEGIILIQEEVDQQKQFGRMYNLEELPEGKYTLFVENKEKIIMQSVVVNRRFLSIYPKEQKEILKPAIKVATDIIAINMLHFEKEAILITLATEQGQIVYSHSFKNFGSFNKQLNISRLPEGQYSLEVQTNIYAVKKDFIKNELPVLMAGKF